MGEATRLREVKSLTQDHTASKWQGQNVSSDQLSPVLRFTVLPGEKEKTWREEGKMSLPSHLGLQDSS